MDKEIEVKKISPCHKCGSVYADEKLHAVVYDEVESGRPSISAKVFLCSPCKRNVDFDYEEGCVSENKTSYRNWCMRIDEQTLIAV